MDEKDIMGKHFQFEQCFMESPMRCGILDVYQIGDICCECGFEIRPHNQTCDEISFIVSGQGTFFLEGQAYPVREGDIFLCSRGQEHHIITAPDCTLRFLYLGFMFNQRARDHEQWNRLCHFYDQVTAPLVRDQVDIILPFMQVVDEFYNKPDFHQEMIECTLTQILLLTYRSFASRQVPVYQIKSDQNAVGYTVYSAVRYIEDHIFELKEVRQVSGALGYSYSYLSHLFRNKTGMTLQQYIHYKKIEKSLQLFKYGNLNVTQVATRLRYETVQSFSKAFKRTMGFSPGEYIRRQKSVPDSDLPNQDSDLFQSD